MTEKDLQETSQNFIQCLNEVKGGLNKLKLDEQEIERLQERAEFFIGISRHYACDTSKPLKEVDIELGKNLLIEVNNYLNHIKGLNVL